MQLSYWGDIFMYFTKITAVKIKRGYTLQVTGNRLGVETTIEHTYQYKKVAKAVGDKLKNISGI